VHKATTPENPPFMAVNTHPSLGTELNAYPGIGVLVDSIRKGADERQLQHHVRVELAMNGQEVRKPKGGRRILAEDTGCAVAYQERVRLHHRTSFIPTTEGGGKVAEK
jgi:hypothetical protein